RGGRGRLGGRGHIDRLVLHRRKKMTNPDPSPEGERGEEEERDGGRDASALLAPQDEGRLEQALVLGNRVGRDGVYGWYLERLRPGRVGGGLDGRSCLVLLPRRGVRIRLPQDHGDGTGGRQARRDGAGLVRPGQDYR